MLIYLVYLMFIMFCFVFQLDAKNSPLALLAQTCSAIGKEPATVRKTSLPSKLYSPKDVKKNDVLVKSCVPSSGSSVSTGATSPGQSEAKRMSPFRTLKRETSPVDDCSSPIKKRRCSPDTIKVRDNVRSHSESLSPHAHGKLSIGEKRRSTTSLDETDSKAKLEPPTRHKSLPGVSPTSRSFGGPCGCPTSSTSGDTPRSTSQTTSPQQLLSLYDPYCMGCQGPHLAGNPCLDAMKLPNFSLYPFANPSTYPIYAQMLMAARNASAAATTVDPTPHVCNWVNADTGNCGKRFSSAEELFTHLRTHAVSASTSSNSNFLVNGLDKMAANPYATYLSQQAAALAAASPSSTNPLSANFLSRSHSPMSRFQSYKATSMLSQLSGLPSLPIAAGMSPYCSPYSMYGQRLGAAASGFSYP